VVIIILHLVSGAKAIFYNLEKLKPISIIFATLYAEGSKCVYHFPPHLTSCSVD